MLRYFRTQQGAFNVYLLLEGGSAFFLALVFTVNMVYQATVVGLNPLQLVLVGTTLEVVVFAFEVPTGIVADVYSRRLSIIIGVFLIGAGFVVEGAFPVFGAVLAAQVLWGLGATFTSGATQAWIADEVGEDRAAHAFLRGSQVGLIAGLAGTAASTGLGMVSVQLPIVIGGMLFVGLGLLLTGIMPENGFHPTPRDERTTWQTMAATLRTGTRLVRARPLLMLFMVAGLIMGLYSEGFDRLWTPHLIDDVGLPDGAGENPVLWFGVIRGAAMLLSLAATELVRRRLNLAHPPALAYALAGITGTMALMLATFALAHGFGLALFALWTFNVLRSVSFPLQTAWLNAHVASSVRATVFSLSGQIDAIGQIGGGPIIGWIGQAWSMRAALLASTGLLAAAPPIYLRLAQNGARPPASGSEAVLPE